MPATATATRNLFISGSYRPARNNDTFTVINPATNVVLASVAKAAIEDVDEVVQIARRAFDDGPWPRLTPHERGRVIQRIADRIRERADERVLLGLQLAA